MHHLIITPIPVNNALYTKTWYGLLVSQKEVHNAAGMIKNQYSKQRDENKDVLKINSFLTPVNILYFSGDFKQSDQV